MRKADIKPGFDLYWAPGRGSSWRYVPPTRATVVTGERVQITRRRCGAFYIESVRPDPDGNAVVVDLHHPSRIERRAVPIRELRGLWRETLAATGRTEAGVKALDALIAEMAATPATRLTDMHLLRVAARDEGVDDDTFGVLARQLA
mgnify:CR=1 FL=1